MNYLLLPDFIAITLLVTVLLSVKGKRSNGIMRLWMLGLFLILLECAARIVYGMHTPRLLHLAMHAVALDSYGLAGAFFLLSASRVLRRMPNNHVFLWINVIPHLALFTVYGFELETAWIYRALVLVGLGVGFLTSALFRRSWQFYAAFTVVWIPLLLCTQVQQYRSAIYLSLFFLYALSALFFYGSLRRGSRGKIAVVAGFGMWALCFATHPWIAMAHPGWTEFASQFWNMQKFVITVGLLLVLLEDQIRSNEWLALHDGLTGLPNRRLFDDRVQNALARAGRNGHRLAIFNLDLDGFKEINDTLGHDAGDILLQRVARNLNAAMRRTDTLARHGGDEFSVLMVDLEVDAADLEHASEHGDAIGSTHLRQVQRLHELLVRVVREPVSLGAKYEGAYVKVTASVGSAIFPDDGLEARELMRLADQRMYFEKEKRTLAALPPDLQVDRSLQTVS